MAREPIHLLTPLVANLALTRWYEAVDQE